MAKHHPDLIMCRKLPGVAIGRLCEKCTHTRILPRCARGCLRVLTRPHAACGAGDGKCVICDSYVRPATLVRVCDECNYGSYAGRCVICGGIGISDAYYCKECTMQEKDVRGAGAAAAAARRERACERAKPNAAVATPACCAPAEGRLSKDCQPRQREDRPLL